MCNVLGLTHVPSIQWYKLLLGPMNYYEAAKAAHLKEFHPFICHFWKRCEPQIRFFVVQVMTYYVGTALVAMRLAVSEM